MGLYFGGRRQLGCLPRTLHSDKYQRHAANRKKCSADVDAGRPAAIVSCEGAVYDHEGDHAYRQVHIENPAPGRLVYQETAGQRADDA